MAKKKGVVITHPGSAHFDDLFATCLVIYRCSSDNNYLEIKEVRRKKPSEKELEDPNIWKLDIGGKFNPKLKQFDHHLGFKHKDDLTEKQQNLVGECAFSMLLKEWDEWERASRLYDWLDISRTFDAWGPKKVVDELDISFKAISCLGSFIESSILTLFQKYDKIKSSDPLFSLLHFIGKNFFESISDYYETIELVEKHVKYKKIKNVPVIHYPHTAKSPDMLTKVLKDKKEEKWGFGGIVIYPNNRPEGSIAVMRYEDDERVDFTRIAGYEHVIFAHSNGFLVALDESISDQELERYIRDAID
jgi:hypothetical protein